MDWGLWWNNFTIIICTFIGRLMQQSEELEQQLFDLKDHIYDLNEELSMRIRSDVISIFIFFIESHCKIAYQENDGHWNNVFFLQIVVIKKASFKLKHYREPWKVILVQRTVYMYYIYIYMLLRMSRNCKILKCRDFIVSWWTLWVIL